jgi:hypothetical protein
MIIDIACSSRGSSKWSRNEFLKVSLPKMNCPGAPSSSNYTAELKKLLMVSVPVVCSQRAKQLQYNN